jgi:hypothetical protein
MRKSWMVLAGLALMAAPLGAQEPEQPATPEQEEEARPEPVFRLKVLEDPYDISSFYRSSGGGGGFYGVDEGGGERRGNAYRDPYSIAGYYRSGQRGSGYGYSQFWISGYSGQTRGQRYRRHIGENGDLFFFAPAILAPVGPLSEVFLGGR